MDCKMPPVLSSSMKTKAVYANRAQSVYLDVYGLHHHPLAKNQHHNKWNV